MGMARLQSLRSTCSRLQVGALVHRDGRILCTGYNGAPRGVDHCDHERDPGPCLIAAHAERNLIDFAARHGIRLEGAEMILTDTPCAQCAGSIINAGIISVIAAREYRDPLGSNMLRQAGVSLSSYEEVIRY